MAILSTEKLLELNLNMVGRGAPDERDNYGYNKVHWNRMFGLSFSSDLTPLQRYAIADALYFYSSTQLSEYKDDLKETLQSIKDSIDVNQFLNDKSMFKYENYEQQLQEKEKIREARWNAKRAQWLESIKLHDDEKKIIHIVGKKLDSVDIRWDGYVKEANSFIKTCSKEQARWRKEKDLFILNVSWDTLPELLKHLKADGYHSDDLDAILEDFDSFKEELKIQIELEKKLNPYVITIVQGKDAIDELTVFFDPVLPNDLLKEIAKEVDAWDVNNYCSSFILPIKRAHILYDYLKDHPEAGFSLDTLLPWSDRARSWEVNEYPLLDVSSLNLSFTPYDFQPKDAQRLLDEMRVVNANEMGCGKTFEQVIVGESIPEKKLVICPETLRLNWKKEILMVNPSADISIIRSKDKAVRISDDWNIVGYKTAGKFLDVLLGANFNVVMADEAHFCKSINNYGKPTSARAKDVLKLCALAKYVYPITGTPKPNNNRDVYNLFRMTKDDITQKPYSFNSFAHEFCGAVHNGYGWDFSGNSNNEQLNELLKSKMVRHLRKDVLPHLDKVRNFIPIEFDIKAYTKKVNEYLADAMAQKKTITELGSIMTMRRILSSLKIDSTMDFADSLLEEGKKVVLVCSFSESIASAKERYKDRAVVIEGGMSDEAKEDAKETFQRGDADICLLNVKAGGVGITLTASYNMIINDYEWLPVDMTQVEDRICRGDQKELCNIFYMYAEGADMDEYFTSTLSEKFASINETVDGGLGENVDMKKDVLDALRKKDSGQLAMFMDGGQKKGKSKTQSENKKRPVEKTDRKDR